MLGTLAYYFYAAAAARPQAHDVPITPGGGLGVAHWRRSSFTLKRQRGAQIVGDVTLQISGSAIVDRQQPWHTRTVVSAGARGAWSGGAEVARGKSAGELNRIAAEARAAHRRRIQRDDEEILALIA